MDKCSKIEAITAETVRANDEMCEMQLGGLIRYYGGVENIPKDLLDDIAERRDKIQELYTSAVNGCASVCPRLGECMLDTSLHHAVNAMTRVATYVKAFQAGIDNEKLRQSGS